MHRIPLPAARKAVFCLLVALLLSLTQGGATLARAGSNVSGVVLDSSGATVAVASVSLLSAQQVTVGTAKTDPQGRFTFSDIEGGTPAPDGYLKIHYAPFARRDLELLQQRRALSRTCERRA